MKLSIIVFSFLIFIGVNCAADVYVHGYTRSDGTYVQPHYRSNPDSNPYNNWSTQGNTNPYTGQQGYRNPNDYNNGYQRSNYGY